MGQEDVASKIDKTLSDAMGEKGQRARAAKDADIPPPSAQSVPAPLVSGLLLRGDLYSTNLRTRRGLVDLILAKARALSKRFMKPFLVKQSSFNSQMATALSDALRLVQVVAEDTRDEINRLRDEINDVRSQLGVRRPRDYGKADLQSREAVAEFVSQLEGVDEETKAKVMKALLEVEKKEDVRAGRMGEAVPSLVRFRETYRELVPEGATAIDLSASKGEFLEVLKQRGIRARGVEPDPLLVKDCREKGLDVVQGDPIEYAKGLEGSGIGLIFATGLAERLPFESFRELMGQAFAKLDEGGVFLVEGINPFSTSGEAVLKSEPRNVRSFNPRSMHAMALAEGFREVKVEFVDPASGARSDEVFPAPYYLLTARK